MFDLRAKFGVQAGRRQPWRRVAGSCGQRRGVHALRLGEGAPTGAPSFSRRGAP